MSELIFSAWAPSNIALIKYMGKKDSVANLPENGSISMTLDSLRTYVELTCESPVESISPGEQEVRWIPESPRGPGSDWAPPVLSSKGKEKVLTHAKRVSQAMPELFKKFGIQLAARRDKIWTLRTANTFPQGSGIASSASSFAAITLAVASAKALDPEQFKKALHQNDLLRGDLARLARQGSGSSCRSLLGPWVYWEDESVSVLPSNLPRLAHFVLLISETEKQVSSSEAHLRVKSSPLWIGRVSRVNERLSAMQRAIASGDLPTLAKMAWTESWEMHSLFHTAEVPFTYWESGSVAVLRALAPALQEAHPPIITMDAGPNVHILVDQARSEEWKFKLSNLAKDLGARLLSDQQGTGGQLL